MIHVVTPPLDHAATVREILADHSSASANEISDHQRLALDLGIDSLAGAGVLVDIEQAFDIQIHDLQWQQTDTVGQLVALVGHLSVARELAR